MNKTQNYYRYQPIDLMTEYTICESLSSLDSPYMVALKNPRSYGSIIGERLREEGILERGCRVCEVGGGYGSLMKGLLEEYSYSVKKVFMTDLSMFLLRKQRETLKKWGSKVTFINGDIGEIVHLFAGMDVIIFNEMMGDLDTWKIDDVKNLPKEIEAFVRYYELEIPTEGPFNFNYDALRIVETLCKEGTKAFIAEHSSDPVIPATMEYLEKGLDSGDFPREIRLKGHSEFTIRFSHLVKVARALGRDVMTGSLIDLVGVADTKKMRFIFLAHASATDEQEVIYELLDHIREYRWLIIK
ncbi:MAG: class I SAM-dependent methyltransferase [Thermodesulfobacteriota bacterium]|nr:class I SAM-dependent methyltransferase [Thermodesulfobacteriota bacterium]